MNLSVGMILLIVVGALIYLGLAHRVLDRMRLSDRGALLFVLAMLVGSFIDVTVWRSPPLVVNLGGAVIPLGISIYLVVTADKTEEKTRAIVGSVLTGGAIWALSRVLNPDEQTMMIDPLFVYAAVAALVAYVAGRSRRASFVAGTTGILLADIVFFFETMSRSSTARTWLGGAGIVDATVIAGFLAVLFSEVFGETREKLLRTDAHKDNTGGGRDA